MTEPHDPGPTKEEEAERDRLWREVEEPARVRQEVVGLLAEAKKNQNTVGIWHKVDGIHDQWVPTPNRLCRYLQEAVTAVGTCDLTTDQIEAVVLKEMKHR